VRQNALPTLVVALLALLAFAVAAGTVGDPATTGTAEERGVERDADPRTEFPRVEGGGGTGGIRGLVGQFVPDLPGWAVMTLVGVGALVLVVLWRTAGGDAPEAAPTAPDETEAPVQGVTAGATRAPDWAQAPADNDVYSAWRRLADHVHPRRHDHRTPADYAALAREAGVDDDAVGELTRLFRRVRYGPAGPTPERERRAREALERAGLGESDEASGGEDADADGGESDDADGEGDEPDDNGGEGDG
jgi:hypothetical protein